MNCPHCNGKVVEVKGGYQCTKCKAFFEQHRIIADETIQDKQSGPRPRGVV
jgi:DNA-directed RNA polymerase subunit RPC12/RpoP